MTPLIFVELRTCCAIKAKIETGYLGLIMIKGKDIKRQKYNSYVSQTTPKDISEMLDLINLPDLFERVGHLLVEMNDGDLVTVWLSSDPKPSRESLYEVIYEN